MKTLKYLIGAVLLSGWTAIGSEQGIQLLASKDAFGRSNKRNANSGATAFLLVVPSPGVRSLISFDLRSVTNEIIRAEISFKIVEDNSEPLSLEIALMALHEDNQHWVEGAGNLGIQGQNARAGENTFQWCAYRNLAWKTGAGQDAINLMDSKLWYTPTMKLNGISWTADTWVHLPILDLPMLEECRNSSAKVVTFGMWGTAGKGIYKINSKESGHPARLILQTKAPEPSL